MVIGSLSVLYNSSFFWSNRGKDRVRQFGSLLGITEDGLEEALGPPPSSLSQWSTSVLCVIVFCWIHDARLKEKIDTLCFKNSIKLIEVRVHLSIDGPRTASFIKTHFSHAARCTKRTKTYEGGLNIHDCMTLRGTTTTDPLLFIFADQSHVKRRNDLLNH